MRAQLTLLIFVFIGISGFSQTPPMISSGSATGACDCYTLTDNTNQAGSIWSAETIDLTNPFNFTFSVNLGANDTWGADGMTFALRQSGTSTGSIGNGMGYGGILNSIGIEIDTWNSSPAVSNDIASDHLGMSSNGGVEHDLIGTTPIANIEDGLAHAFQVIWNPVTLNLEVILDGASMFTYNGDMVALFFGGNPAVYFGWTAGTGGVGNTQSVCMYRDANFTPSRTTACEGQAITFSDASIGSLNYDNSSITDWNWDFGDGNTSSDQNPTHTYTTDGSYTATLVVTDLSGCTATETVNITITNGLSLTLSENDVSCFGLGNGSASAIPTTGAGPYTYAWDDGLTQSTQTATNLVANNYNVLVTDAIGCVGTGTVSIAEPTALVIDSATPTNANCSFADGSIVVLASGGTSAYEYSKDGGTTFQTSNSFLGLLSGTYSIVVKDVNGCTATTMTTVDLNSSLIIDNIVTSGGMCAGDTDGIITITASGGVGPYMYSIDAGTTFQMLNTFNLLMAGNYTITVEDAVGCSVAMDAVVGNTTPLLLDLVNVVNPTCNGDTDGEITITVSNGTIPYTYSIDGGTTTQVTGVFSSLTANVYNVHVEDASGCVVTQSNTISEPTLLNIDNINIDNNFCAGSADGAITIVASGGTPGYLYSKDGGGSFQTSAVFNGLNSGIYNLVIQDANGCSVTGVGTITEPSALVVDDIVASSISCAVAMDGDVTITASGGTGPYEYKIDGFTTYQSSNFFDMLGGGVYNVIVRDALGCMVSTNVIVPVVSTLMIDLVDVIDPVCNGGLNGEIAITSSGGTAGYQYSIDGGATYFPSSNFIGLAAATYTVQILDGAGCIETQTAVVSEPSEIAITSVVETDISCTGMGDGEIDIAVSGGTPSYTFSKDGGISFQTSSNFSGLTAGLYNLMVADVNGCTVTNTNTINEPFPLIIEDLLVTNVTCNGLADGGVEVITSGGTGPFTYDIGIGLAQTSPIFIGLSGGIVDMTITDANGCSDNQTAFIAESDPLVLALGLDTIICIGGMANLCPDLAGGTAPYVYNWNGTIGTSCLSTAILGAHTLMVEDVNGCTSSLESQVVTQYNPLSISSSSAVSSVCPGDDVIIAAEASGDGPMSYTYEWTNDMDDVILSGPVQTVQPDTATNYTVTVSVGCENTESSNVSIITYPVPDILIASDVNQGCEDLEVNFTSLTDETLVASLEWDLGNGKIGFTPMISNTYENPDCYPVNLAITTVDGCEKNKTLDDFICVWELPIADFSFQPEETNLFNTAVDFYNESSNADFYEWNFGDDFSSTEINPEHIYPERGNQTYTVALTATTDKGCTDKIEKRITVKDVVLYFIPNAFTPDGNLLNESFEPVFIPGFYPQDYHLTIINRWGEIIFESYDQSIGWDGTYGGKLVDVGTYLWQITFLENESDRKNIAQGHFTVLK